MEDSMEEPVQDVQQEPAAEMQQNAPESTPEHPDETLEVQKRLKSQKRALQRAHEMEMSAAHARISDLESRMNSMQPPAQEVQNAASPQDGDVEALLHRAYQYGRTQSRKEEEEQARKELEAKSQAHLHQQYQDLGNHLDRVADKYDDFDEVVRGQKTPFTPTMANYALTLPKSGAGSAGEVLYKLGKNPEELSRIAQLYPIDQASEMARLSHALISGVAPDTQKSGMDKNPLGSIRNNPVTSSRPISDKTSISELRDRIKAGWK